MARPRNEPIEENTSPPPRGLKGGEFIFDTYNGETRPIWGDGGRVIWMPGEPCMIVGNQGVGKTSLAQQLSLSLMGIREATFLGYSVTPMLSARKVLYLAMDRPRQIARSFARMVTPRDRKQLDRRLIVWRGPLSHLNLEKYPHHLVEWIEDQHKLASHVIPDSMKDLAAGLSSDDVGAALNSAIQYVIASGREFLTLHHNRKRQAGNPDPSTLDDVYGSRWLTSGHGSVVLIKGQPGSHMIEFRHLKPAVEPVGPFKVLHDHARGVSRVHDAEAGLLVLAARNGGVSLREAAMCLHGSDESKEQQRARRALSRLVDDKVLEYEPGAAGGAGGGAASARWTIRGRR